MAAPRPFLDGLDAYVGARYTGIVPLPARRKSPPPNGRTGGAGVDYSVPDLCEIASDPDSASIRRVVAQWMTSDANIGWRVPGSILGIDVDNDPKSGRTKSGAQEIAAEEARLGALPPTYYSSNRGPGSGSRHLVYRITPGTHYSEATGGRLPSVEFIQNHHRFLVVWPSVHPSGRPYAWYSPAGVALEGPPPLDAIPPLPQAWAEYYAAEYGEAAAVTSEQAQAFLQGLPSGEMCEAVSQTLARHVGQLQAPGAGRHPAALRGVLALLRMGERGHHGVPEALGLIHQQYLDLACLPGAGSRTRAAADGEFHRMVHGARGLGLLAASPTPEAQRGCNCPGQSPAGSGRNTSVGRPGDVTGLLRFVALSPAGECASRLFWAACKAIDAGLDAAPLAAAAAAAGLSPDEIRSTGRRVARRTKGTAR